MTDGTDGVPTADSDQTGQPDKADDIVENSPEVIE
jgi:hypothetical protein